MISASTAREALREYAVLEPGWDSYDAPPVSGWALSKANDLITRFPEKIMRVAPFSGGITVEWGMNPRIQVDIANAGTLGYLVVVETYSENSAASAAEIDTLLTHFAR